MLTMLAYSTSQTESLRNFLQKKGVVVTVLKSVRSLSANEILIIPDGKDFEAGMSELKAWQKEIKQFVSQGGVVVGVGLGLHLLGEGYAEPEFIPGLGLLPGVSYPLIAEGAYPVPANQLQDLIGVSETHPLTNNLTSKPAFYRHNYFFDCDVSMILALSQGFLKFPAIIVYDSMIGLQFTPELSGEAGNTMIENILAYKLN